MNKLFSNNSRKEKRSKTEPPKILREEKATCTCTTKKRRGKKDLRRRRRYTFAALFYTLCYTCSYSFCCRGKNGVEFRAYHSSARMKTRNNHDAETSFCEPNIRLGGGTIVHIPTLAAALTISKWCITVQRRHVHHFAIKIIKNKSLSKNAQSRFLVMQLTGWIGLSFLIRRHCDLRVFQQKLFKPCERFPKTGHYI